MCCTIEIMVRYVINCWVGATLKSAAQEATVGMQREIAFCRNSFSSADGRLTIQWAVQIWKKAFDTVDYQIVFQKLQLFGIDFATLKWVRSYVTDCKQKTFVNGTLSDHHPIVCGVSQGSILGLLLFLVYINDLPMWCLSSTLRMYADDTCLTLCARDPEDLQSQLNSDLVEIQTWFFVDKCSSISFHLIQSTGLAYCCFITP